MPTDRRTMSGVMPAAAWSASLSCWWGRRGGMNHQALGVAHVGEVREQLQGVDELPAGFEAALDPEREDSPLALGQVLLRHRIVRAGREIGVVHPSDQWVRFEMLREGEGVGTVQVHAQGQGLQGPAGTETRFAATGTARGRASPSTRHLRIKASGPNVSVEDHAVIAGAWFGEHGELAVGPVELAPSRR